MISMEVRLGLTFFVVLCLQVFGSTEVGRKNHDFTQLDTL